MTLFDISKTFSLEMPLEMFIRGTAVYWFLFLIFRVVLRRDVGSIGIADVLLLVLLADASQNAMANEYTSVGDGFVLIATLVFWNLAVDWLCYRFPAVEKLMGAPTLCLVRDGRIIRRNMRREFISHEDLMSQLRQHGVEDVRQVHRAYLESDGNISVLKQT
ncbi:MAG: conserved hypothetical rane protein [Rhodocyclales bacterium]|nr:conserved hypothetical rane protein [Rhodocyclales bacterium]